MVKVAITACLLAASLSVSAQVSAPPAPPTPPIAPVPLSAPLTPLFGAGDDVMLLMSAEFGGRDVVKAAPYAATAINETRQVLNDGNRIERSSTIKLYRDGQGRTRQDQADGVAFINDVVAGRRYVLNTQRRSARELKLAPRAPVPPVPPVPPVGATPPPPQPAKPHAQMSAAETRSWAEEMRRWAQEMHDRIRGENAGRESNVIIRRNVTTEGPDITDRVEIIRIEGGQSALPSLATMPSAPGPGTTTALGNRDFDGVRAQGTKTTWTIAAGRIGNKLPIEIVSERWYSPELNLVVLSRHADPRSGERIYRLENIMREEPSAELFNVPADYALKTTPARDADRK